MTPASRNYMTTSCALRLLLLVIWIVRWCDASSSVRRKVDDHRHEQTSNELGDEVEITTAVAPINWTFPIVDEALHLAELSYAVYYMSGCDDSKSLKRLPQHVTCHTYVRTKARTEVMVAYSDLYNYVAICFAGTDNARDFFRDLDLEMVKFGTDDDKDGRYLSDKAHVHAGFNKAVFDSGVYHTVASATASLLVDRPKHRLVTTGHSLGGADSILTAVALALDHRSDDRVVESLSFGTPMTGNQEWKDEVNAIPNLRLWRVVYEKDIIPRMPGLLYHHPGHTLQINGHEVLAYYLHYGNKVLGLAGVPLSWTMSSWLLPFSIHNHLEKNYVNFFKKLLKKRDRDKYWVHEFVSIKDACKAAKNSTNSCDNLHRGARFVHDAKLTNLDTEVRISIL